MRAVDTNVTLRYLLGDVPDQSRTSAGLIESDEPLGLTAVTLAEIAWTLAGPKYRLDRTWVAGAIARLLSRENIVAVGFDKAEALMALSACARSAAPADFGDAPIAACARSAGIEEIYSFDQRFARAGLIPVAPA